MAEWSIALAWRARVRATAPWVRIPPSPKCFFKIFFERDSKAEEFLYRSVFEVSWKKRGPAKKLWPNLAWHDEFFTKTIASKTNLNLKNKKLI